MEKRFTLHDLPQTERPRERLRRAGRGKIENQKRFLVECLDNNYLYVNYSEIDDEEYGVSEEDKGLNREFYKNLL